MSRNLFSMVDVAVDGDVIYVMENHHVYAYDTAEHSWSQLPDCTFRSCPSAIINNLLTLIGGIRGDIITNKLFSLTKKGKNLRWTEEFPQSMLTNRWGASACTLYRNRSDCSRGNRKWRWHHSNDWSDGHRDISVVHCLRPTTTNAIRLTTTSKW